MITVLYALLVAALALCFGRSIVDAIVFRWEVDRVTRWALAFPALVLFAFVLMLAHLATGGAIFSNAWLTRGLTILTAIVCVAMNLWRRPRLPRERLKRWQVWSLLALCGLGVVAWGLPIAHVFPLNFTPDTDLHMGWASQLMIGESSPSTVVTGDVPGYYPWLYHALVALLARFTPGGRSFDALGALQLLQVIGVVSGLFALGRYMTDKFLTGAGAAFFGSMCGGFGVGMLFDPQVWEGATHLPATTIPWLGDVLSRRPYNFGFNNVAPAYPRDLSFSLLVGFLLLLLIGLKRRSYMALSAGGVALGLVGLAGGEAVIVGAGVGLVVCLAQREVNPIKAAGAVLLPMLAVYGTWLVPLISNYLDLGGFVNTTHVGPVVLTLPFLVLSWGLTTPFALVGLATSARSVREPGLLIPLGVVLIAGLIMASNLVYEALGNAFLTLGRDHRYWALCHLGLALFAAVGATAVLERMRRFPAVAVATAVLIVGLGVVSPVLGSTIYPQRFPANTTIAASLEGDKTYLNAMAPEPGMRCVAAVPGNAVARQTFSYTGYRLVQWVTAEERENWARIRWTDIYRYIPDDLERARANQILTRGVGSPDEWLDVVERFGVDFVLVPQARADSAPFDGFPQQDFSINKKSFTLVRVKDC